MRPLPSNISMEVEIRINELTYKLNQLSLENGMLERDRATKEQQL